MKLPKFQDTGRLLGYGHVTFVDEEARKKVYPSNELNILIFIRLWN